MEYRKMTYGKAIDTIEHIEERTDEEIALAIYRNRERRCRQWLNGFIN